MDMVRIDRFTSRVEAELACSMLTARGLNARVSADDVAGIHPDIPFGIGGTAVVVPREQYEDAIALLDEEFVGPFDDGRPEGEAVDGELPAGTPDDEAGTAALERSRARGPVRRPGLRVFAVVAAVIMAVVFVAVTGAAAGWW